MQLSCESRDAYFKTRLTEYSPFEKYLLVLMPLMAPGWQNVPPSGNNKLHELLHESVTITTRQANGCPKARSDAPPGYDKGQGSKHNRAVGMLGKQGGYL